MPIELPDVSKKPGQIARDIELHGYAVLERYIQPHDLESLVAFAEAAVDASGGEYAGFKDDQLDQTLVGAIHGSPKFQNLCKSIYEAGTGIPAPKQDFYRVLRCLKGASGRTLQHSLNFHYDSYALTVLLPVVIPTGDVAGDLLMVPNVRLLRPSVIGKILDSVFVYNPLAQRLLRFTYRRSSKGFRRIKLVPGNLYMFWGNRCLHANEPSKADSLRATALFHYGRA